MKELKVGDVITVNDFGCTYSLWEEMFERHKFKNTKQNRPPTTIHCNTPYNKLLFKVFAIDIHSSGKFQVSAIRCIKNEKLELLVSSRVCDLVDPVEDRVSLNQILERYPYLKDEILDLAKEALKELQKK